MVDWRCGVVVKVRDEEKAIGRCLESLRNQTVELFLVVVHSEGNPQLRLDKFADIPERECFWCHGRFKTLKKVEYISGLVAPTCDACLQANLANGPYSTVKRVLGVIK